MKKRIVMDTNLYLERELGGAFLLQGRSRGKNYTIKITEQPIIHKLFRKWNSTGKDIGPYKIVLERIYT